MLADLEQLREFLDAVYEAAPCPISIKTRLGLEDPEEFGPVLELYNQYPVSELIIHPRVRKDFYRHPVRTEAFERALAHSGNPVSYNGSIVTPEDYAICAEKYPQIKAVMVGRALCPIRFWRAGSNMESAVTGTCCGLSMTSCLRPMRPNLTAGSTPPSA